MERKLTRQEATSAAQVQTAIDALAGQGGGKVILPEMELTLDRGLHLRSGIELIGQGEKTVLCKGPGRVYPLSGYHNYGMCDAPLKSAAGLEVGMTVSVHDRRTHGGFYETFATITWINGNWVGLDHGIEADYSAEEAPCLTTIYPLVCGHRIRSAAVRHLRLEGNRQDQEKAMGGCRGGAVYFAQSRELEIEGVIERDYLGEGLSFQMCRNVRIIDCRFDENTGNGLHPGAGSTNALFERCRGQGNERSGFFFCVRANHIAVQDCTFKRNRLGVSIGTRDCHNRIEDCTIEANRGAGVLVRPTPRPTEVHSCLVSHCRILGNALEEGRGQVEITSDAHDLIFENNRMAGCAPQEKAGVFVEPTARQVFVEGNQFKGCAQEVDAPAQSLARTRPQIECGYGEWPEKIFRHLDVPKSP
jgi:hypothetical protein